MQNLKIFFINLLLICNGHNVLIFHQNTFFKGTWSHVLMKYTAAAPPEDLEGRSDTSDLCLLSDLTLPPQTALLGSACQVPQTAAASSWAEIRGRTAGSVSVGRADKQTAVRMLSISPSAAASQAQFSLFCLPLSVNQSPFTLAHKATPCRRKLSMSLIGFFLGLITAEDRILKNLTVAI